MKKLIVITGLLLAAVSGFAAPASLDFTSFNQGLWELGYPYIVTVNGVPGVAVMCDDWAHGGLPGDKWQANVTDLGAGNLTNLRFNQLPDALTLYDEAGWLLLQTKVTLPAQWPDINYAVWHIFDSTAPLVGNAQYWFTQALQEASNNFPGVNFHDIVIYTPLNQYGVDANGNLDPDAPQELMSPVPEPMTFVLLAGGLLGVWGRKQSQ